MLLTADAGAVEAPARAVLIASLGCPRTEEREDDIGWDE